MGTIQVDRLFEEVDPRCTFDYAISGAVFVMTNVLFMRDLDGEPVKALGSVGKILSANPMEPEVLLASLNPFDASSVVYPSEMLLWHRGANNFLEPGEGDARGMLSLDECAKLGQLLMPVLVHTQPWGAPDHAGLFPNVSSN